jgi:hypothetical protein
LRNWKKKFNVFVDYGVSEKLKIVIDAVGGDMYLISINALNRVKKLLKISIMILYLLLITNMKNK